MGRNWPKQETDNAPYTTFSFMKWTVLNAMPHTLLFTADYIMERNDCLQVKQPELKSKNSNFSDIRNR